MPRLSAPTGEMLRASADADHLSHQRRVQRAEEPVRARAGEAVRERPTPQARRREPDRSARERHVVGYLADEVPREACPAFDRDALRPERVVTDPARANAAEPPLRLFEQPERDAF